MSNEGRRQPNICRRDTGSLASLREPIKNDQKLPQIHKNDRLTGETGELCGQSFHATHEQHNLEHKLQRQNKKI